MHFTSYLLSTLLAVAPALVLARDCTHFETFYQVPCPNNKCRKSQTPIQSNPIHSPQKPNNDTAGGKLEDYGYAFRTNENEFETWAGLDGNGYSCGGWCQTVKRKEMGAAGYTFQMRCVAPRMRKWFATGMPGYKEGLERTVTNRACDVSCTPNDAPFNGQHCEFTVSFISRPCGQSPSSVRWRGGCKACSP